MASSWEDALAQVKTDLAGINGTGSYTYKVEATSIYRDVILPESAEVPAIIMLPGRVRQARLASNNRVYRILPLTLAGVLAMGDLSQAFDTQLNAFARDIHIAMTSKAKRLHANTVIDVQPGSHETVFVPERAYGLVLCDFELEIHGTWDLP